MPSERALQGPPQIQIKAPHNHTVRAQRVAAAVVVGIMRVARLALSQRGVVQNIVDRAIVIIMGWAQ